MEEQPKRLKFPIVAPSPSHSSNSPVMLVISVLFIVAAIIFAVTGWYTVYNDSYSARVVGGDAYNFIIYATRGTALI